MSTHQIPDDTVTNQRPPMCLLYQIPFSCFRICFTASLMSGTIARNQAQRCRVKVAILEHSSLNISELLTTNTPQFLPIENIMFSVSRQSVIVFSLICLIRYTLVQRSVDAPQVKNFGVLLSTCMLERDIHYSRGLMNHLYSR
jgi:hypothetical protein